MYRLKTIIKGNKTMLTFSFSRDENHYKRSPIVFTPQPS